MLHTGQNKDTWGFIAFLPARRCAIFISIQRFIVANAAGYFIIKFSLYPSCFKAELRASCQLSMARKRWANALI
jgi:hypothetical protein